MKINKFLFVAGAVTALGVAYALCRKYKMHLVSEVEDTMVKGCCGKTEEPKNYDFEETTEVDIVVTDDTTAEENDIVLENESNDSVSADDGCGCND